MRKTIIFQSPILPKAQYLSKKTLYHLSYNGFQNILNHLPASASRPRVADNFRHMKWGY